MSHQSRSAARPGKPRCLAGPIVEGPMNMTRIRRWWLGLRCTLSASIRSPQTRRTISLKAPVCIEIQTHRIWIGDKSGSTPFHPRDTVDVVVAGGRWPGIGIFRWQPTKGAAVTAMIDNVTHVQNTIKAEEEKCFALLGRAPEIIAKQLKGRQDPTDEDLIILQDTHGIHAEIVLSELCMNEDPKRCDSIFQAVRDRQESKD